METIELREKKKGKRKLLFSGMRSKNLRGKGEKWAQMKDGTLRYKLITHVGNFVLPSPLT